MRHTESLRIYPSGVADRRIIGSWLQGPGSLTIDPDDYPGRRLGLPQTGPGSVARFGRRIAALCIDWALCLVIAYGFAGGDELAPLAIFAVENFVLVAVAGQSAGHRALGIRVTRMDGGRPGLWRSLARAALLVLAIPALLTNRDQRGLHDRLAGTVLRRV